MSSVALDFVSQSYFVAQAQCNCWRCSKPTRVIAFVLPAGFGEYDEDEDGERYFDTCSEAMVLSYVTFLPYVVSKQAQTLNPHFHLDESRSYGRYWMNHCEHCRAVQGDHYLIGQPEGPFFPMEDDAAAQVVLFEVNAPFECCGDCGHGGAGEHLMAHAKRGRLPGAKAETEPSAAQGRT